MSRINYNAPERWKSWLRACQKDESSPTDVRDLSLGIVTGQDARALHAFAACLCLYASSDDDGRAASLDALRCLLGGMQRSCYPFARELIAQQLDWRDRDRVWYAICEGSQKGTMHIV